jgi:hypothetical protein
MERRRGRRGWFWRGEEQGRLRMEGVVVMERTAATGIEGLDQKNGTRRGGT